MKLFLIIAILLLTAISTKAACEPIYGIKDADGFWTISWSQMPGMNEIVTTVNCKYDTAALELIGGKWVPNPAKAYQALLDKITTLEAKTKALEDAAKLPK